MERTFTPVHSKKICKYLLFALVVLVSATSSFGQTSIGDYRSKASGNWSDASTWQVKTASTDGWQDAVTAPTTASNVYVQDLHTITLTANADCKDFNSNTTSVTTIGTNTLNVYGKIRAYTGVAETSAADGTTVGTSTTVLVTAMITTSTGGLLKFVGNSRTITAVGEWNSTSLANDVEFALTAGQTGSLATGIKFRNVTISSGIVSTTTFISIGTTAALTIKSGARLISSRSGATSAFVAFSSTVKCGTVNIENGAVLELTGTTPSIDCTTFINNGTVEYSRAGSQTFLQRGADATSTTALNSYDTLVLSGTNTKTPFASITVSTLLQFKGTATLGATAALSLTMLNGSTVDRGASSGTSLPSATGAVLYGTSATDLVNVTISFTLPNSNEVPATPTPGKVGTLTIASGVTYTFSGGRTVTNLVNNGFIAFSPATTLTFTIEGSISGTGTINGHVNASIAFTGANSGNAGTLNFTSGSQVANGLTINRTGTNASVTLGTPVTLSTATGTGTLSLTEGTLIGNDNLITVTGNINGTTLGVYTATSNGKILMAGKTSAATIASVTLANLELNDADGFTLSSPKITGVLTVSQGTATISGTLTLKSDANSTASIANSAGTITGNVTVERYIPSNGRRRYVLVGSPVTSTIKAGWQEGGSISNAGYGTLITGGSAGGTNGFDLPTTSAKSIFTYNDDSLSGKKWVGLANTDATNLAPGAGYLLFVRGDRTLNIATNPTGSGNTTLRATGAVGQGSISPTLLSGASKYTLIANPYPCAIDWNSGSLTKTNLTSSFTVYDANNSVFVSSNGTVKTPSTGKQQASYIQSGQAFFVQNTEAGNGAITFTEGAKTIAIDNDSDSTVFGEGTTKAQLNINVYRTADNSFADGVVVLFGNNYKTAVDSKEDIYKFTNLSETFGLRRNNIVLGLEARPRVQRADTMYFSLKSFAKKSYKLVLDGNNFEQTTSAKLEDKFTGTSTVIDLAGITNYNFTISDDAASSSNDRFIITFGSTAANTVITDGTAASLYVKMSPNPVRSQLQVSFKTATVEATNINVVNSLGQVVKTVNAGNVSTGNVSVPVAELATGVYTVQLISAGKVVSTQQVVKAEN